MMMAADPAWAVALLAGFFGGGHCVGMCSPIVVLLENQPSASTWLRRLAYNVGRGLFYMLLGAIAGIAGLVLTKTAGLDVGLRLLRLAASAIVVALGLDLLLNLRLLGILERAGTFVWTRLSPLTRHVLPAATPLRAIAAGFLWGALPCGLVYGAVALAATSGHAAAGALTMAAFWLGTLPALLLVGASAQRVAAWSRTPALRRVAGAMIIVIGLLALALPIVTMRA